MAKKSSDSVTKLATRGRTTSKKKTETVDEKAKERVEELLKDVDIDPKKRDDLLEFVEETPEMENQKKWLEEQLANLSEENEALKKENVELKNQLNSTGGDDRLQATVANLFNELQKEHFKRGSKFHIHPIPFMKRMITFFPFLEKERKF